MEGNVGWVRREGGNPEMAGLPPPEVREMVGWAGAHVPQGTTPQMCQKTIRDGERGRGLPQTSI